MNKNRSKSRSGCRTCKLRRPGCQNCTQKGFECPGYQQRLQWSTKHERPTAAQASGPANFTQLVTAASESIVSPSPGSFENLDFDETTAPVAPSASADGISVSVFPSSASASTSPSSSSSLSSSSSSSSPTPKPEDAVAGVESNVAPVPAVRGSTPAPPTQASQAAVLTMARPVVNIPTFLIEHWFKSVCSSWSAFDSQSNPYRRLTASLWDSSTPVFYALQSISAASLVERLPHVMRDTARSAPRKAVDAIRKELGVFSTAANPKFPSELLLALFCMSSSMCWMESRQLGQQFVRQARAVLKSLDGWALNAEEQELLRFFNGCLIYEEMLRSVVSDEEIDFEHMLSWPEPSPRGPLAPTASHPWTGVSVDVLRLFGKAIALCRRSRTRWRLNDGTSYRILQCAMKDIDEATRVNNSLLAIDAPPLPTPACNEPPQAVARAQDLHYATEAYRLCSLLQLYETFPDLSAKHIPLLEDADESVVWHTLMSPLALHITNLLGNLPAGSMSCIQPLLCLCTGSGLRYDSKVPLGHGHRSYLLSTEPTTPIPSIPGAAKLESPFASPDISQNAVQTSMARQFLMNRLDELELNLPPKPIGVAKQLLRAVWNVYDQEIGLPRRTHWLDVMSRTGLHSLFG
ncbi:hypothetical protein BT67DRAFT_379507 [Trichocladium antarcticum]|uniref:Zn(2)-C6 fungal-type domain-containing protein n=1 Tax=Trichocladium antarcticum TaxID=1450529 RepID=A0AAN6UKY0_9PEZI|nr:hypothetical protein BT67DRAFT_379507 [Trichocladium antarcticum]